jgi:hypothetical protein
MLVLGALVQLLYLGLKVVLDDVCFWKLQIGIEKECCTGWP